MKVNILYNTTDSPYGGGNQFLRALKERFIDLEVYSEEEKDADIFLFNSHHNIDKVKSIKSKYTNKIFIHRIDGPIRLYNRMTDARDDIVYEANNKLADATVFQSVWSKNANLSLGMNLSHPSAVIKNAADPKIFYDHGKNKKFKDTDDKIKIISTSFSPNIKKGFRYYQFLDQNLDFRKVQYVFAGNSPVKFENIKNIGCLNSVDLSQELKNSDIYVTASENDPCSNSLIEALSSGLPAIALNSGGHPEIIGSAGELFSDFKDLLVKISAVASNINQYRNQISVKSIDKIASEYIEFFKEVLENEA